MKGADTPLWSNARPGSILRPMLSDLDKRHLLAAVGWLELGPQNLAEATEELDRVEKANQGAFEVLGVRLQILLSAKVWREAVTVGNRLIDLQPSHPEFWIGLAYATRRMDGGGIPQARQVLLRASDRFKNEPIIFYNLACYECQLGDLDSARSWLDQALAVGDKRQLEAMARTDPDLLPLRVQ